MKSYVVRQGDYLAKIAFESGVDAETLWTHPKNAALAQSRGSPDILAPGDILYVPDAPSSSENVAVAQSNDFSRKPPTVRVHVRLIDDDGKPMSGAKFTVEGAVKPTEGSVAVDGAVSFDVTVTTREAVLHVPERRRSFRLAIGAIDPVTESSGALARLQNLGFCANLSDVHPRFARPIDTATSLETAVRRFQQARGLTVTGLVDDATRAALVDEHGC